jgi:hypothetical protein
MTHMDSKEWLSLLILDGFGEFYLFNYLFIDYLTTLSVVQAT